MEAAAYGLLGGFELNTPDSLYIRHVNSNLGNSATLTVTNPHSVFLGGFLGSTSAIGKSKKSMLCLKLSAVTSKVEEKSDFDQKIKSEIGFWTLSGGVLSQILPRRPRNTATKKLSGSLFFQNLAGVSLLQHSFSLSDLPNKSYLNYNAALWQLNFQSGLWQKIQIGQWFSIVLSAAAQYSFATSSSVSINNFTVNDQDVRYKSSQLKIREKLDSNQFTFPLRFGFQKDF